MVEKVWYNDNLIKSDPIKKQFKIYVMNLNALWGKIEWSLSKLKWLNYNNIDDCEEEFVEDEKMKMDTVE